MTLNIAHRGFSSQYPENTMLAFRKAVEAGCDGIELDIHLSRDGVPVIIHDYDLRRVGGREGRVPDLTAAELGATDVSGGYSQYGHNPVPTLREYLAYIRDHKVLTNIELKNTACPYPGLEEKALDLIREYGLLDRVYFSSFNHASMVRCKQLSPQSRCALLTECILWQPGSYAKAAGVDYINGYFRTLTDSYVAAIHAAGLGVQAWTVDEEEDMVRLLDQGVYGIITNKPDRLHRLLQARK